MPNVVGPMIPMAIHVSIEVIVNRTMYNLDTRPLLAVVSAVGALPSCLPN